MAILNERCGGYKAGMVLLLVGTVIFVSGFATPNWVELTYQVKGVSHKLNVHGGLWVTCVKGEYEQSLCVSAHQSQGWELAVKGLEGASLGLLVLSVFFAFYINCMAKTITNNRALEVSTGLAAVLGISGVVLYAVKFNQDVDLVTKLLSTTISDFDFNLSWSFGLTTGGLGVVLIACILLSVFNKPLQQPPLPNTTFSNINGGYDNAAAATAVPPPGMVNVYATPGSMTYTVPPPHCYTGLTVQGQVGGQGYAVGQIQSQASGPMMFDTHVGVQKQ
ncbi:hypothetical protein ACOMHN_017527 [Nucella lapillus]